MRRETRAPPPLVRAPIGRRHHPMIPMRSLTTVRSRQTWNHRERTLAMRPIRRDARRSRYPKERRAAPGRSLANSGPGDDRLRQVYEVVAEDRKDIP